MLRKLLLISFLFGAVAVSHAQKKDKKKKKDKNQSETPVADSAIDYKVIGSPLPALKLTTREGDKFTDKDFKSDGNLFVMMFNPTCDHCQSMTLDFEKNIELFNKTKIVLVAAPSMMDYLEFYNNVTRYSKYEKITVAIDSAGFIDKAFTYGSLPQINVYDKNRKLVKIFAGETTIDALKPYIE